MGERRALLLLLVLAIMCHVVALVSGYREDYPEGGGGRREREEREREREEREHEEGWFLLQDSKHVVKTDAGDMRVVRGGFGGARSIVETPMHIGFITMEPQSLFIPQYLDSTLILFIRRGGARIGMIYKDDFVEKILKMGDIYRIPAGSAFYLVNTEEGQRLHVICSIDTSESLRSDTLQSFFIGGGTYPTSVLAGFDPETLATAFNVSVTELREVLTKQEAGPIVHLSDSHSPSVWTQFMQLKEHERVAHLKRMVHFQEEEEEEAIEEEQPTWSFRKFLNSVFGEENKRKEEKRTTSGKEPDSYNLYNRRPDFRNNYGWSMALDESDYTPLRHSGVGVYLVNLTAGSMMAPHVNPTATEYGIVLRGSGTIQIVYPNGTSAMNAQVSEGDVFWVPRYFPFCQIASRTGPFEFFGFTTSARKNRPQFLVGRNSILQTMRGDEFAAAFGVSREKLWEIIDAQNEAVILPSASAAPPEMKIKVKKVVPKVITEVVMDFD
ncbi:vicilin-like seed storage protein At2g28490 [Cornus florida]|uniref:vicilin-like seed storage protein At2g28490 n=1 Tax=Cornus florida TaxID=4283 RepID=UPI0028A11927|nr:vicilin-like seed storage protein At2g28490 [Cornus florida]